MLALLLTGYTGRKGNIFNGAVKISFRVALEEINIAVILRTDAETFIFLQLWQSSLKCALKEQPARYSSSAVFIYLFLIFIHIYFLSSTKQLSG